MTSGVLFLAMCGSAITQNQSPELMALSLLGLSLRCPVPPYEDEEPSNAYYKIYPQYEYSGDNEDFVIEETDTILTGTSRGPSKDRHAVDFNVHFSDLGSTHVSGPDVILRCRNDRACISSRVKLLDGDETNNEEELKVRLCDDDTASNVKAAIDILAHVEAHSAAQSGSPPEVAAPATKQREVSNDSHSQSGSAVVVSRAPLRTFRVVDNVSQGILNMRDGPGIKHNLVVAIPAGADDLSVNICRSANTGKEKPWCQVTWHNFTGWVSSCCIVDSISGILPTVGKN